MSYFIVYGGQRIAAFTTTGLSLMDSFSVLQEISTRNVCRHLSTLNVTIGSRNDNLPYTYKLTWRSVVLEKAWKGLT
jgi:hypothetical protein